MLAGHLISVEYLALPNTMLLWLGSRRGFKLPPLLNHHRLHWSPCLSLMKRQQHERERGCSGELGERPHRKSSKDLGVVESPALSLLSLLTHRTPPRCPCAAIQRLRGACLLADQAYFGANGRVGPGRVNRSTKHECSCAAVEQRHLRKAFNAIQRQREKRKKGKKKEREKITETQGHSWLCLNRVPKHQPGPEKKFIIKNLCARVTLTKVDKTAQCPICCMNGLRCLIDAITRRIGFLNGSRMLSPLERGQLVSPSLSDTDQNIPDVHSDVHRGYENEGGNPRH
jgi:hypothetical protein